MSEVADRVRRLSEAKTLEESVDRIEESATKLLHKGLENSAIREVWKAAQQSEPPRSAVETGRVMDARNRDIAEALLDHVRNMREAVAAIREEVAAEEEAAQTRAQS